MSKLAIDSVNLIARMLLKFPGLSPNEIAGPTDDVNGGDLVDWLTEEMDELESSHLMELVETVDSIE